MFRHPRMRGLCAWILSLFVPTLLLGGNVNQLQENNEQSCENRSVHAHLGGLVYFFSWAEKGASGGPQGPALSWADAGDACRHRCMELVSLETPAENDFVKQRLAADGQKFAWTSGRKCNFAGCERPDLQPASVVGWFWAGSHQRMPPITDRASSDWSHTGGMGRPQPDDREGAQGGAEEACLALLNNLHGDGVRWHDVACHHRKPFVCEGGDAAALQPSPSPPPPPPLPPPLQPPLVQVEEEQLAPDHEPVTVPSFSLISMLPAPVPPLESGLK